MDLIALQAALAHQEANPHDIRAHEKAIGAGLLRWADWPALVLSGEGAAGTVRRGPNPLHAQRRREFDDLDVEIPGQKWALVEMQVVSRLEQSTTHAKSIGTLLVHDGVSPSVQGLLRMYSEASLRGLWLGNPNLSPTSSLERTVAELADVANSFDADSRRKLHSEVVLPAAQALNLTLYGGRSGRWNASKTIRPTTRDLLWLVKPLDDEMASWAARTYKIQTASVHSSIQSWFTSMADDGAWGLQTLVLDLLQVLSSHHQLEEIYEGWYDWQPREAMDESRRAMMSAVSLALIRARQQFVKAL